MSLSNKQATSKEGPKKKKPSTAKPRKRAAPKDRDENGKLIRSEASISSRKRHCPRLTAASLQIDDENDDLSQFTPSFSANSHSHNTWGIPTSTTIKATKRKRKISTFNQEARLARNSAARRAGLFDQFSELSSSPEPKKVNCPARSFFLRLPLEIRERIYGYFLRSPKSIIMNYNWKAVERCPNFAVGKILFICKQITMEALSFLYNKNTFHALLKDNKSQFAAWSIPKIPSTYLHLIRNAILECPKGTWDLKWYHKASKSIGILALAQPVLETFTIVLTPQQVGISSTALGLEACPITFADFLWDCGEVLRAITSLNCRKLRVVVKQDEGRRIILEVIIGGIFTTFDDQKDWFENDRPYQQAKIDRKKRVKLELAKLKEKFEIIFNDEGKAIEMGWCRVMGADERLVTYQCRRAQDGMSGEMRRSRFNSEFSYL